MKQIDFYSDRDCTMLTMQTDNGEYTYTVSNRLGKVECLVQCTKLGIWFNAPNSIMAHKIMEYVLGEKK